MQLFSLLICSASLAVDVHAAPLENGTCPSGPSPEPSTTSLPLAGCDAPGGFTCPYYNPNPGRWGNPEPYGGDGDCVQQCPYVTYEGLSFATKSYSHSRKRYKLSNDPEANLGVCIDYCVEKCQDDTKCRTYSVHIGVEVVSSMLACVCYLHDNWLCDYGSNCEDKYTGKQCITDPIIALDCVISAVCRPEQGWIDGDVDC